MPEVSLKHGRIAFTQIRTARMEDGQLMQRPHRMLHIQAGRAGRHPEALLGQILEHERPAWPADVNGACDQLVGDAVLVEGASQCGQHRFVHDQLLVVDGHAVEQVASEAAVVRDLNDAAQRRGGGLVFRDDYVLNV